MYAEIYEAIKAHRKCMNTVILLEPKMQQQKTRSTMIIMKECTHAQIHSCKIGKKCFIVYFLAIFLKKTCYVFLHNVAVLENRKQRWIISVYSKYME